MKLTTNPDNPRTITSDAYNKLKRSIQRNPDGLTANKIAHKDGVIISGNQRYRAILELKLEMKPEWFKDLSGWTQEQIEEWVIQSNISAGEWDWDILANEWDDTQLEEWGVDMPDDWGETKELPDNIDDIPEVKTPISKLGDLWLLGEHRVLCGDSTDASALETLMGGAKANMVFTDPPYNVDYTGKTKDALKIDNDSKTDSDFLLFLTKAFSLLDEAMHLGAAYYICHADSEGYNFRTAVKNADWELKQCLIWNKNSLVMGRQDYQWKHEPILYGWKPGAAHYFVNDRKQTTVWDIDRPSRSTEHPTMKPVELIARAIKNSSKPQQIILDTFLGSGSTLIACEETNRQCYGIELDPAYVDVIVNRWCKLTGKFNVIRNGEKFTWQNQDQEKA